MSCVVSCVAIRDCSLKKIVFFAQTVPHIL